MNTFRKPPLQLSFSTWPQTAAVCDKYNPSVSFCPRRFSLSTGGAVSYSSPLLALCYPLLAALCFAIPCHHACSACTVLCFPTIPCYSAGGSSMLFLRALLYYDELFHPALPSVARQMASGCMHSSSFTRCYTYHYTAQWALHCNSACTLCTPCALHSALQH